ncbi:MAG: hypothetical protein SVR94_15065 [Pseudomonadota bacterium]|nr:hypothetical protein [Pseudomonadota bacterium]
MKIHNVLAFVLLATLSFNGSAKTVTIQNGFLTGNDFRILDDISKNMYVTGLIDGMFLAPFYGAPEKQVNHLAKCTEGMTASQVRAIFDKYIKNNPEKWHQNMHVIGHNAIMAACKQ